MDLKGILAISGQAGLYKHVSKTRNGLIVESLLTKKRIHVFTSARISALQDIAVYTTGEERPLPDILREIYKKQNSEQAPDTTKATNNELKNYFEQILPEYDKERVYVSDIKRVISWYNLLNELKLVDLEIPVEEKEKKEISEEVEIVNEKSE